MARRLKTRQNANGYTEFYDQKQRRWVTTHRRSLENALGRELPSDVHVHHINHDKTDNRPENLVALAPDIHFRIHHVDSDACFRCGRSGHWAENCYASTKVNGEPL
jgi:hypothetical protein